MKRTVPSPTAISGRILSQPLVHFLCLGALLYGLDRPPAPTVHADEEPVVITSLQIDRLRARWRQEQGRDPDPEEESSLVDGLVNEELIFREALRRRMHSSDLVVWRRLSDKMSFLEAGSDHDPGQLVQTAVDLGLHRDDPIIRRRLIEKMRLLAGAQAGPLQADEHQIRAYYERHQERFMEPARLRLSQVFSSRERWGPKLEEEALRRAAEVRNRGLTPEEAVAIGDPFLLGHHLPFRTLDQLARIFGAELVEQAAELEAGVWSLPLSSAYGSHLVWVHEALPRRPAALASVRHRVLEGMRVERRERRLAELVAELRLRYPVRIETGDRIGGAR
ncbi:MAG: peptidyl-prolyl cis-trans isomerase [Holophagales bacterium]|nr:peptidyl-prolyl cis-trans isomerase [Holophagales bacterium]